MPLKRKPQYLPGPTPKKRVQPDLPIASSSKSSITSAAPVPENPSVTRPARHWKHPFTAVPSIRILKDWLDAKDVWMHDALGLQDARSEGEGGLGVFGKGIVSPQTVVCKIPRSAILSSKTSCLPSLLPPTTVRQLPPIVLLSLSLLYELRQAELSEWYGYIQSLPRRVVPLVCLWNVPNLGVGSGLGGDDGKAGLDILRGTEVDRESSRIKRDEHSLPHLELYHKATESFFPLTTTCPEPPTLQDLLYAYSLVSSRAFGVDHYHGTGLVPLADAFNHRDPPENHVHFESDDFVCPECGSLPACSHDGIVGTEPAATAGDSPSPTPIPARLAHLPLEIILSFSHPSQQTLDMMCVKPFSAGEEIFNTYGEKMGWAKMLVEWGFIDDGEGGEALGEGMHWELKDVLRINRSGREGDEEDQEDLYEFRRKVFKKLGKTYTRTDSLESPEEEPLLFQAGTDIEPKNALLINGDGQISDWMLLALLVNQSTSKGATEDMDATAKVDEVLLAFKAAQACLGGGESAGSGIGGKAAWEETKSVLIAVADQLSEFIDKRVEGTSKPTASAQELLDEMDAISQTTWLDRPLSRMAIKLLIEERRVLEVVASKLEELKMDLAADGVSE